MANWVSKQGGLPSYIKRIVKHLRSKGMSESHAIAVAVNAAKKMCATGDVNWPGSQQVNAGSRAEACAAVKRWEAMKAAAGESDRPDFDEVDAIQIDEAAAGAALADLPEITESDVPERLEITEAIDLAEAPRRGGGEFMVQLISPGWGSSGYYSAEVLEAAGKAKVFPAGTHMYLDHPTATEAQERPERSVTDLAAVLKEDARWNGKALVARVRPYSQHREVLAEMKDDIGVSVRAYAEVSHGEAEGRSGVIIERLDQAISADFVTKPGRGGRILEVLESAREQAVEASQLDRTTALTKVREARNVGQWLESRLHLSFTQYADDMYGNGRLTREERIALSSAVGDALEAFTASLQDGAAQLFDRDLWADPDARVAAAEAATPTPQDVPVNPAGQPNPRSPERTTAMPEIEETRLRQLEEAEGRVPTLEAERDAERQRAETAETALAEERARVYAREYGSARVREANSELPGPVVERIVAEACRNIPLGEDRRLDTAAFNTLVDEARKAEETYLTGIQENVGRVRGLGPSNGKPEVSEADLDKAFSETFKEV